MSDRNTATDPAACIAAAEDVLAHMRALARVADVVSEALVKAGVQPAAARLHVSDPSDGPRPFGSLHFRLAVTARLRDRSESLAFVHVQVGGSDLYMIETGERAPPGSCGRLYFVDDGADVSTLPAWKRRAAAADRRLPAEAVRWEVDGRLAGRRWAGDPSHPARQKRSGETVVRDGTVALPPEVVAVVRYCLGAIPGPDGVLATAVPSYATAAWADDAFEAWARAHGAVS